MSEIDTAIARLQALALQSSTDLRHAPTYPIDDAAVLPMAIAHLTDGNAAGGEATFYPVIHRIGVDFHVSRVSLRNAYAQLDAIVPRYFALLAGDPTLNDTIDSVNLADVTYTIQPAQWDNVTTLAAFFVVPIKYLTTPSTSS